MLYVMFRTYKSLRISTSGSHKINKLVNNVKVVIVKCQGVGLMAPFSPELRLNY